MNRKFETNYSTRNRHYFINDFSIKLLVEAAGIIYFGTNHGKIVAINCSSNGLDGGPWPKYKRDNFNSGRQ